MSTPSEAVVELVTRTICTLNEGGYCDCIGESRGCKVGRGEPPEASRCKMTDKALPLTSEYRMARAVVAAMTEPTSALRLPPSIPLTGKFKEGDTVSMHADGVLYRGTVGKDGSALLRPDHA